MTATRLRWACGCEGPSHPFGTPCVDAVPVAYEDDGCEPGNHRRDVLCARTRIPERRKPEDDEWKEAT